MLRVKNMLSAAAVLLGASLIILVPTLILVLLSTPAPAEEPDSYPSSTGPTTPIDFDWDDVIQPAPKPSGSHAPKANRFSGEGVIPVADSLFEGPEIDFSEEPSYNGPYGEGEDTDIFSPGWYGHGQVGGDDPLPSFDTVIIVDELPVMVRQYEPEYPSLAKKAGLEGSVWIKALVDKDGTVRDVRVLVSSSVASLDDAAVKAGWKNIFRPAIRSNRPVAVWVSYRVEFKLE